MVLPYGGRVGWRRIVKAVMIYIVTAFFMFMKIANEDGVSGLFKSLGSSILYVPAVEAAIFFWKNIPENFVRYFFPGVL